MPSQYRKQLKKEELESEDEDNKCLGSMLRRDKVNEFTPSGTANSKVLHNVKKEECQDSGTPQKELVNSSSKSVKVKKVDKIEYDSDSDSDDDKPISRKSVSKNTKASNVKKEEAKDSDSPQKKPVHSSSKSLKVKKVDKFECDYDDDKRISRKTISKNTELVEKKTSEVKKSTKSERKVYDLPGQKRDPPEERDSVRIFYESLYNQVPDSEMAAIWMMESGLLPEEEARKVLDRKQKKNPLQKLGSLVKVITSTTTRSAESASKFTTVMKERKSTATTTLNTSNKKNDTASGSNTVNKSKKRKKSGSSSEEEDSDDDFVISIVAKRQKAR